MADIDSEKVIKDLDECLRSSCRGFRPRLSCPYNDDEWDIMRDAFAMLKEQEQAMKEKDGTISNLIMQIKGISQCYERIVRCKDCKNWIPGYITDQDDFIPPKCGKYQQMVGHSNDDFCSFAEKKEGR